jgi:hypothetical protein
VKEGLVRKEKEEPLLGSAYSSVKMGNSNRASSMGDTKDLKK